MASQTRKRKRKVELEEEDEEFQRSSEVFANPHLSTTYFHSVSDLGVSTSKTQVYYKPEPAKPSPQAIQMDDVPVAEGYTDPVDEAPKESETKQTQNSRLLADFETHFPLLLELLLASEANPQIGEACSCGKALRSIHCRDCLQYQPSCKTCFIQMHHNNPFHWAEVWDEEKGFFVRHDISRLGFSLQLGHYGEPCPSPHPPLLFTVIDTNGIHGTSISFCGCMDAPTGKDHKIKQLMTAGLFPGTTRAPETAYTFRVLKELHLHLLESKKAVYDYLGALRRLTDNVFTSDIPDPNENMLRVLRVWRYLNSLKRSGQGHGIDKLFPQRLPGDLCVHCPACPEPGLNMNEGWQVTPSHLRHLNQLQRTLDGNFQCNKMKKNSDPDDISLFNGKAYFPEDRTFRDDIKLTAKSAEKSTCSFLKVVNKQNSVKFKNMDITGTVNCQCSHVFILASVDLFLGERFAHVDYSLAHSLRRLSLASSTDHSASLLSLYDDIDQVTSYDAMCQYCVHLLERFEKHFPDLTHLIQQMRYCIPALHVMGHKEACQYLFGTPYMKCVGHFHGETAEQYWPEANQLGPQTRQMNNGHRQDTLIDNHSDWNWKKTINIISSLITELVTADRLFQEKRDHFVGLSSLYSARVSKWKKLDRVTRGSGTHVDSVYKHRQAKVPSQVMIYQGMLARDAEIIATSSADVPMTQLAIFLNEGLIIQADQRRLRAKVTEYEHHPLESLRVDISTERSKLTSRMEKWRMDQKKIIPSAGDFIVQQDCRIEHETLFLPSDFDADTRDKLGLTTMGLEEAKLREGEASDALDHVRNAVKTASALKDKKVKNDRGQDANTRSAQYIRDADERKALWMATYNHARATILTLRNISKADEIEQLPNFPPLTPEDTYMKSRQKGRILGDSRRMDGKIWRAMGQHAVAKKGQAARGKRPVRGSAVMTQSSGTQMTRRMPTGAKKAKEPRKPGNSSQQSKKKEGWIWDIGKQAKMNDKEMAEWEDECDRIQWFRAEAEMERWQEQYELKLAELLRTLRTFSKMAEVWTNLATSQSNIHSHAGHIAYARQKAHMFSTMHSKGAEILDSMGFHELRVQDDGTNKALINFVSNLRSKHAEYLFEVLVDTVDENSLHEDSEYGTSIRTPEVAEDVTEYQFTDSSESDSDEMY